VPNRLSASTSPYLLQHADNPVDWFEWGDEAFAEARRRDVPVLISVGYAACHWCHVMAHESFEDSAVAMLMNAYFVSIKVDREERPDVDAVYMEFAQAITGRGGWPMTVFATPEGQPIYVGTYFPPRPMSGMPAFSEVLATIATAWRDQRAGLLAGADRVAAAIGNRVQSELPPGGVLDEAALTGALDALSSGYDERAGGFGGAPKFPPSMVCEWLLRHHARTGSAPALAMAERTLEAMARGGMYDQLGGGFARYSVDADWVVPHFEKMLYDNALLLRVYAHWWRATGSTLARRVTEETAAFLVRELRTPQGGFASSLDADSPSPDGHPQEGAFYVWTPEQLAAVLGPDDGAWATSVWGVTAAGTFGAGASVLQLRADPGDVDRYASVRGRMLASRELRPRPARDDKVVASWNGLAIAALADSGALLEREDWVAAARATADLLVELHLSPARPSGSPVGAAGARLARTSRDGVVGHAPGVLEDYANVAEGLLALFGATGEAGRAVQAGRLLDGVLDRFGDGADGFFDTAQDATDPVLARIGRPRDVGDGPTPAGQAAAAGALLGYAALTGSALHREAAERALTEPLVISALLPRAAGWALATAEAALDGPREIAVVGEPADPATRELRRTAVMATAPGSVIAVGRPGDASPSEVALLRDRPLIGGRPTAYVCRRFVCERPVTDPVELAAQLR
jgi:hypothetical protein